MSEVMQEGAIQSRARGSVVPGALWTELRESFRHPEFWALSGWLDIIVRARKSRFGVLWLLAPSVVYVFILGAFFRGMQSGRPGDFLVHVALGAMVFRTLMSTVIGSANVFGGNYSFIMDGHMRLTDYLLESLAKSFFDMCMYIPVVTVALVFFGHDISFVGLLLALPSLVLIYVNALWMSVVFSLLGARFSDFGQLLGNISIFLFLLTPIIWYPEMMPAGSYRGHLMRGNPFFHLVEVFRSPIMGQPIETLSLWYVGIMTVVGLLVATLVYRRYARFVPLWI